KRPCDDERDGKSGHDCEHNKAHGPVWNFEKWKNLCGNLNQKPADDRVRDRDFVNVAPLEFGEKRVPLAHGVVLPGGVYGYASFARTALKRGSSRNGSKPRFQSQAAK